MVRSRYIQLYHSNTQYFNLKKFCICKKSIFTVISLLTPSSLFHIIRITFDYIDHETFEPSLGLK